MLAIVFALSVSVYGIFFGALVVNYAGSNPMDKLNGQMSNYISIFPEGWAFFTRPVRESSMRLYSANGEKFKKVELRGFVPEYDFGASRENRILTIELSNVLAKLNLSRKREQIEKYIVFDEDLNKALSIDTLHFCQLAEGNNNILLKGKYILVLQDYLPWSLIRKKDHFKVIRHVTIFPFQF
jgi:antimicrobial peptide system SdpA family protein